MYRMLHIVETVRDKKKGERQSADIARHTAEFLAAGGSIRAYAIGRHASTSEWDSHRRREAKKARLEGLGLVDFDE